MAQTVSDETSTPNAETFVLDTVTGTVVFEGGARWKCGLENEPSAARLTSEAVIRSVVTHMLASGEPVAEYRAVSLKYKPGGIDYCVFGSNFDPITEATWECWVWMVVPKGMEFFPDYGTIYVRDSDGKAWTLERKGGRSTRRIPSYQKEASPWDGKPQSQRKKKA